MKTISINKKIGKRMKIARISRDISQESMAEDLGISVSAYSNMERGEIDITITRIIDVAKIFKIKWPFLLGFSDEPESDFERNIINLTGTDEESRTSKSKKTPVDVEKEIDLLKQEITKLKKK